MKWALVDKDGIVKSIIIYDGKTKYDAPTGLSLIQINDWVEKECHKDCLQPLVIENNINEEKRIRNEGLKNDLALIAAYRIEAKSNPTLTFSDYLDDLEKEAKLINQNL